MFHIFSSSLELEAPNTGDGADSSSLLISETQMKNRTVHKIDKHSRRNINTKFVHYKGKISVHVRVLARPVGRDHTGVQAGVKAGVSEPVPCFLWFKGAVHFRGGRDAPRIAQEQHR